MDLELIEKIDILKEEVKNTLEYKNFYEIKEKLENSEEVALLSYKKDQAILEYQSALRHYGENHEITLKKSKEMSEAIYNLANNELVKKYNVALNEYNKLLKEIDSLIFGELND